MPRTPRRLTLLAMIVIVLIAGLPGGAVAAGAPFTNPVKAQKGADPWIEYYNGNYYLVTTSWTSVLTTQRWRFEDQADDTSRLVNANSGKVADVANCGTADGTAVRQWTWLNNTCQQWRLRPA